jgi:potassium uptake TrkH family protein
MDAAHPLRPPAQPLRPRGVRHPARLIAGSFAITVLVGTALLALPPAAASGDGAPFVTALFTSTAAVCVTGLAVVDTGSYWSPFGQVVLLALIQVGGLGIMSLTTFLFIAVGRRVRLRQRVVTAAGSAASDLGSVRRLALAIGLFTVGFELLGAALLTLRFAVSYDQPLGSAAWHGVFHAISAFNNCGFGLRPDNLVVYAQDPVVSLTVAGLLIFGGLGFPVWLELRDRRFRGFRRFTLHTKLVVLGSLALIAFGTLAVLALEWSNPATLGQWDAPHKLLPAFFQGVTPRTAGFNTVDYAGMHEETWITQMMLMFVGGAPASTAGGIKVTTFAVLLVFVASEARGVPDPSLFGRRIPAEVVRQSFSIAFIAMNAVVLGSLVLLVDTALPWVQVLFESISAFGTVGLSTGITGSLPNLSQLVLVALMFLGRTGPYTLAIAFALRQRPQKFRYAEESPIVG